MRLTFTDPADVRQRLGKRRYSPDRRRSASPPSPRDTPPPREPISSVHRRLGVASQEGRGPKASIDRKTSTSTTRHFLFLFHLLFRTSVEMCCDLCYIKTQSEWF